MLSPSRIWINFKILRQLGLRTLILYLRYQFGLRSGRYQRTGQLPPVPAASSIQPLFALPLRSALTKFLGEEGRHDLLEEADEIVGGRYRAFGGEPLALKLTGDWPLVHWTEYARGNIKLQEDLKSVWEPARFGWALVLGRAYAITQDEKYADAFWKYFDIFAGANPPYVGPHWMNGQEVAIRLLALVWSLHVFDGTGASGDRARLDRLAESIAAHAARIPPTLVYARAQNNNHLITEAAALYTAGRMFANPQWRQLGWRWLNWSFQNQISGYGEYVQHSTNYHRLMLQSALWVNLIKDEKWPFATMQALTRASHWLFSMLDPLSGSVPNLGANDGALIFPLSSAAFRDFRPTVQAAARAFLRTALPVGSWDEMSLWLGLPASEHTSDSDAYLTDHLRGPNSWAYLRASRFKSHLSHMDQLHFDLWWRGMNMTPDAGTYHYNDQSPWDNPLVATSVHNTVMVDGREQMTRGSRFLTLDWFPAFSKSVLESDEKISGRVVAYHRGYRALGIYHERTASVYLDEHWTVRDRLVPHQSRLHRYRLHWLFLDGIWEIENSAGMTQLRIKFPQGRLTCRISVESGSERPEVCVSVARAGELLHGERQVQPFEGWTSPTYAMKTPALSLAVEASSSSMIIFSSEFSFQDEDGTDLPFS